MAVTIRVVAVGGAGLVARAIDNPNGLDRLGRELLERSHAHAVLFALNLGQPRLSKRTGANWWTLTGHRRRTASS